MKLKLIRFLTLFSSFTLIVTGVLAKTKITGLDYSDLKDEAKVTIHMNKEVNGFPELTVKDSMIQVSVPSSFVWPKIDKKFSLYKSYDSKLMAYQFNKNLVRVRAMLPDYVNPDKNRVSLVLRGKDIVISFPKRAIKRAVGRAPAVTGRPIIAAKLTKEQKKAQAEKYDESYLNKLLKEKNEDMEVSRKINLDSSLKNKKAPATNESVTKDEVNLALAGNEKANNSFSLTSYATKFVGFLALVLLLFYAIVSFFKKGAFRKGKLGFLNSTKVIEVLNTTYIAPKRSLLLIRAHNQVFLVGSSEKGLHMISEIKDKNGLFKEGEKQISGSNFDTNLSKATEEDKDFKLKDFLGEAAEQPQVNNPYHLTEETQNASEDNAALRAIENEMRASKQSTKAKFSDQIKDKVKGLKSLQ